MILSRDARSRQRAYDDVSRACQTTWCPTCDGGGCEPWDETKPCHRCGGVGKVAETDSERDARVEEELDGIEYGPSHHELYGRI